MVWTNNDRAEVLAKARAYLEDKGYEVNKCVLREKHKQPDGYELDIISPIQPFDYEITREDDRNKKFRVSVLIAVRGFASRPDSWRLTKMSSVHIPSFFLVWLPHKEVFIELPGSFFNDVERVKAIPVNIIRSL